MNRKILVFIGLLLCACAGSAKASEPIASSGSLGGTEATGGTGGIKGPRTLVGGSCSHENSGFVVGLDPRYAGSTALLIYPNNHCGEYIQIDNNGFFRAHHSPRKDGWVLGYIQISAMDSNYFTNEYSFDSPSLGSFVLKY